MPDKPKPVTVHCTDNLGHKQTLRIDSTRDGRVCHYRVGGVSLSFTPNELLKLMGGSAEHLAWVLPLWDRPS